MRSDRGAIRWLLLGIALLIPVLVVCTTGTELGDKALFIQGAKCDSASESGSVSAESISGESGNDTIEPGEECTETEGVARVDEILDGKEVFVEFLPGYEFESISSSCTHVLEGDLDPGTSCEGTTQADFDYFETGGGGTGVTLEIQADLAVLGAEPDAVNPATASVTAQCEGGVVDIPVNGDPVGFPLDASFGTCTVATSLTSDVQVAGTHTRILSAHLLGTDFRCDYSDQCANAFPGSFPICGPFGFCRAGVAGDPCLDRFHCTEDRSCVEEFCRDGEFGDPCYDDSDCTGITSCNQATGLCDL